MYIVMCIFFRAKQAMLANEERKRRLMKKRLEEGAAGSTSAGGQEEGKKAAEGAQAGSGQVLFAYSKEKAQMINFVFFDCCYISTVNS